MRIDTLIETFRRALGRSQLKDFTSYSDLYVLFRAVASVLTERESALTNLIDLYYIFNARGTSLDRRAYDYGLTRLQGSKARGQVLIRSTSQDVTIPKGLILSAPGNVLQYEVVSSVFIPRGLEVPTTIESLGEGSDSNLSAGVLLYSSFYPHVEFTIGRYRAPNGIAVGEVIGGDEVEDDDSFRVRLLQWISRGSAVSRSSLTITLQSIPGVGRVFIQEHSPVTGYITVFLGTSDSRILNQARRVVDLNKAAGISYIVQTIDRLTVTLSLTIYTIGPLDSGYLRGQLLRYLYRQTIGDIIRLADIVSYTAQQSNAIVSVVVDQPTRDIQLSAGQMVDIQDIELTIVDRRRG